MNTKKKTLILFIISLIGAAAWFIADYSERGLTAGTFGGVVLIFGIVGIPSLVDYLRLKNKR